MDSNLSLWSLLDSEKLTGLNFDCWYRKLKIILEHEQILYVITDPTSKEPAPNAYDMVWDTYLKWLNDRTMMHCIMRTAMNDEFNRKFKEARSKDMLNVLRESFSTPNDVERHKTSAIFNAQIREGASITDHVLYMIEQIECLSKLGFLLHE